MSERSSPVPSAAGGAGMSEALPAGNANWGKLDALLESLPPGIPLLPPEDAGNFGKYTHKPPHDYVPGDGWKHCARAVEKYDAELCKGYREEIDTLLVFAGLFSAVVTAFTIESYQWLQSDSNDAIIMLLSHIAQSVSHNSTTAPLPAVSTGIPGPVSIRINIYWFSSLSLSLSAALVLILCKQWVREFERNIGLSPQRFLSVHQTKLEGLENWRVGGIISFLPLLLQLALAIFALGVLELLWQLQSTVAALVCVPTMAALLFYLGTTIVPVLQYYILVFNGGFSFLHALSQCPYRSPQAMLALRASFLWLWMRGTILYLVDTMCLARYRLVALCSSDPTPIPRRTRGPMQWLVYSASWDPVSFNDLLDGVYNRATNPQPLSLYRSIYWVRWHLDDGDINEWTWRCLCDVAANNELFQLGWGEDSVIRGLCYVNGGLISAPRGGARAISLVYLLRTPLPLMFAVEACIQSLMSMDSDSAKFLIDNILFGLSHRLDPQTHVTILRTVNAYARLHLQESIGLLIVKVARLLRWCRDPQLRDVLSSCTLALYLNWLHAQPIPYPGATADSIREMIYYFMPSLDDAEENFVTHPEHLRLRRDVHELAELVRIFSHMHPEPALALAVDIYAGEEEKLRPIVNELLDIARHGGGPEATSTAEPATRVPRAPGSLPEGHDCEEPLERSAPNEESPTGACHDRPRRTEPHAGRSAPAAEHDGVSTATESPTLRAVIIHDRLGNAATLQLDGNRGSAARDGDADGDDGRAPVRQSEAGAAGGAGLARHEGSVDEYA